MVNDFTTKKILKFRLWPILGSLLSPFVGSYGQRQAFHLRYWQFWGLLFASSCLLLSMRKRGLLNPWPQKALASRCSGERARACLCRQLGPWPLSDAIGAYATIRGYALSTEREIARISRCPPHPPPPVPPSRFLLPFLRFLVRS